MARLQDEIDDSEELQVYKAELDHKKDEDKLTTAIDAAEATLDCLSTLPSSFFQSGAI